VVPRSASSKARADETRTPRREGLNPDCAVQVWDTAYVPSAQAFGVYRDWVQSSFMPWSHEIDDHSTFSARVESVKFDNGLIGRIQSTPTRAIRTKTHIANSEVDCVYASLRLFGDASIKQGDDFVVSSTGDLVVFDSTRPTIHTSLGSSISDAITLLIPRVSLPAEGRTIGSPYLLRKPRILSPLSICMDFITHNLSFLSRDELNGLFDACVDMLPVATGCYSDSRISSSSNVSLGNSLLRDIYWFIDEHLSSSDLSARSIANSFDISERYVHKLFSQRGATCSYYVTRRRLERVRVDLLNSAARRKSIALVAFRWGFNDLSTFNRAFRKRFGCSPRQFRS
jgi:AraC family transcriptional regulator, positive regulator of tynA and feaB